MPKISALDDLINPADNDVLLVVNDPAGSPVSQKVTISNLARRLTTDFDTRADAAAATIAGTVDAIRTRGYAAAGDRGGAIYKRISTPAPVEAWHLQTADGAYWELVPENGVVIVDQLGAVGDGVTDDTDAIQDALDFAAGKTLRFTCGVSYYLFGVQISANTIVDLNGATLIKRPVNYGVDSDNMDEWAGTSGVFWTTNVYPPMLYCNGENITIHGPGTLNGNEDNENQTNLTSEGAGGGYIQDRSLVCANQDASGITKLTLRDFEMIDAPKFGLVLAGIEELTIRNIVEKNGNAGWADIGVAQGLGGQCIISGCRLHGTRKYSLVPNCFVATGWDEMIFHDNIVDGRDKVTSVTSPFNIADAPKFQSMPTLNITANTFLESGIKLAAYAGFVGENFQVTSNIFESPSTTDIGTGLTGGGCLYKQVSISNNTFHNDRISGVETATNGMGITGNVFRATQSINPSTVGACVTFSINNGQTPGPCTVSSNTCDMGGYNFNCFLYAPHDLQELVIANNTIKGCDHVWANGPGSDYSEARIYWIGNIIENCRSLGSHRMDALKKWVFANNIIGDFDVTTPSSINSYTGRCRIQFNNAVGAWGALSIKGNVINDATDVFAVEFLAASGATVTYLTIHDNEWYSNGASNIPFSFGTSTMNVTYLSIARNTFSGNVSLSTNMTITTERIADNYFLNAGGVVTNAAVGNISVEGTTATTVGAAGGASALPATPTGYVEVDIDGTTYKMPYYAS